MAVFDTATNAAVVRFGITLPNNIAFSPNGATAYIAVGASPGNLVVIDTSQYTVSTRIPVGNFHTRSWCR